MLLSFLFIRWRKEQEREEDEKIMIRLSLLGILEGV